MSTARTPLVFSLGLAVLAGLTVGCEDLLQNPLAPTLETGAVACSCGDDLSGTHPFGAVSTGPTSPPDDGSPKSVQTGVTSPTTC